MSATLMAENTVHRHDLDTCGPASAMKLLLSKAQPLHGNSCVCRCMFGQQGVLRCSQSNEARSLGTHFFSSAYDPTPQYLQNTLAADLNSNKRTAGQPLLSCMPCNDHPRIASTRDWDCTGAMPAIMLSKSTATLTCKLTSDIGPCVLDAASMLTLKGQSTAC